MASVKGFWQNISNGDIYAIETDTYGKIVGGVGPLDANDLHDLNDYDYKPAIIEWLERALAEHKLRSFKPRKS